MKILTGCTTGVISVKSKKKYKLDYSYGIIPIRERKGVREFLLIKHNKGHWAFPKGHKEKGETILEAARRELFEETGLRVSRFFSRKKFVEKYTFKEKRRLVFKIVTYFLGVSHSGRVKISKEEISDYLWLSYEKALKKITFKQNKETLKEINIFLRRKS